MDRESIDGNLERASQLVARAEEMARSLASRGPASAGEVSGWVDPIVEVLEEANEILLQTEAEGLPCRTVGEEQGHGSCASCATGGEQGSGTDPEEQPDVEGEAYDLMMRRQDLEHRSCVVEAEVYRRAADLVGGPVAGPGQATEEQEQMLENAAVALEAALLGRQEIPTLLSLAEVRILQREIRKARQILSVVVQADPDGPGGSKAGEMLESLDAKGAPKDKGNCFIATAACGENAREVRVLREVRDRVLMSIRAGRQLVRGYYAVSPPLALLVGRHPLLKAAVRRLLVVPAARAGALLVRWRGEAGGSP